MVQKAGADGVNPYKIKIIQKLSYAIIVLLQVITTELVVYKSCRAV